MLRSARGGSGGLTGWAQPEQFEPVVVDPESGALGDAGHDLAEPRVVDVQRASAPGADDVVVMVGGLTGHVGVLTAGQVDPLDEAEFGQEVQGPEDRRPADPESLALRIPDQVGSREMAGPTCDQSRDDPPRLRQAVVAAIEGGEEGRGMHHGH